jgi:hypothetical protein
MTFEDWYPFVLPHAPQCPEDTADHHLRLACIRFCSRTNVWVEELAPIVADGGTDFALPQVPQAELHRLLACSVDGCDVDHLVDETSARRYRRAGTCATIASVNRERTRLTVQPAPRTGVPIVAELVLKPSMRAVEVPAFLFDDHAQAVAHGALSTLLLLKQAEWYDAEQAAVSGASFNAAVNAAALQAAGGYAGARKRVRAHFF